MNSWATEEISMKGSEISITWDFQEQGKQKKLVDPALGIEKQTRESQTGPSSPISWQYDISSWKKVGFSKYLFELELIIKAVA